MEPKADQTSCRAAISSRSSWDKEAKACVFAKKVTVKRTKETSSSSSRPHKTQRGDVSRWEGSYGGTCPTLSISSASHMTLPSRSSEEDEILDKSGNVVHVPIKPTRSAESSGEEGYVARWVRASRNEILSGSSSDSGGSSGSQEGGRILPLPQGRRSPGVNVSVVLRDHEVWEAFDTLTTEMIINRNGRRMFPHVVVTLTGLEPLDVYSVWMEIIPISDFRYKWENEHWVPMDRALPPVRNTPYQHSASPNFGYFWMDKCVSFAKVKLTNSKDSMHGDFLLHSKHKYMVQILVKSAHTELTFPLLQTRFIAVTAYQNESITQMKISLNPYARAFKDGPNKQNGKRKGNQSRNNISSDAEEDDADEKMARHYHMKVRRENGGRERLASPGGLGHPFPLPLHPLTLGSGPPGLASSAGTGQMMTTPPHPSSMFGMLPGYMGHVPSPWFYPFLLNPSHLAQLPPLHPLRWQRPQLTPPWGPMAAMSVLGGRQVERSFPGSEEISPQTRDSDLEESYSHT